MKSPYKAYIKIVYDDGSQEECEIALETAKEYFHQDKQLTFIQSIDTAGCSKRIGHYIQILALTAQMYCEGEDKRTDMSSFAGFKKKITASIKVLAEAEGVRYPTLEDQVCRQMNQGKDQLTARVVQFFNTARTESTEAAVNEPGSLYRYVMENNFLSEKVAYNTGFNEQEFLKASLLQLAETIRQA
jgi:hypothetical protein